LLLCRLVDQLEALTPAVPSLFNCKSLTVKGRVKFESGVAIVGDVTLTNSEWAAPGCTGLCSCLPAGVVVVVVVVACCC
jgi:hypothetical protein